MSPHRPKGRTIWRLYVPASNGSWTIQSTGTRDKRTADAMERMIGELGPKGRRDWPLLDAVVAKQLTLPGLYDAYRTSGLDLLRSQLADVDLRPVLDRWRAWLLSGRVTEDTADHYRTHVESFSGDGPIWRSAYQPAALETWLSGRGVAPATVRKYFAAMQSWFGYLRTIGELSTDPLAGLHPPPAPSPRVEFLELPDVKRLVDRAESQDRVLFALLYGTGCDLTPALGLHKRDFEMKEREVRGRGTKAHNRDRLLTVADWAWPYLEPYLKTLLPDAPLFPGLSRWTASDIHRELLVALKLARQGITLHAARHHWAVRMIRGGTPIEIVARQLGHKDGVLCLRVYGRFIPSSAERRRWDREADKAERKRSSER